MNDSVLRFPSKENLRQRSSDQHRGVRFVPDTNDHSDDPDEVAVAAAPASPLESILGVVTAILATWCTAGLMTILVCLYVTVRPFSISTYRRLAAVWGMAAFLDAVTLLLPNCRVCLTGDSDVPSPIGSSVLVANHVVAADWWAMYLLGRCVGLRGSLKVFLRNEFLHINMENVDIASSAAISVGSNGSSIMRTNGSSSTTTLMAGSSASALPVANNSTGSPPGTGPTTAVGGSSQSSNSSNIGGQTCKKASPDLALIAKLLHLLLEFPLINSEDYTSDREQLFSLLRSFASPVTGSPVHLLLYPECWSMHTGADRKSIHAKSNEFAKREGKPALKHLLLPRTRRFNASLECLREASPVVYDVTMVRTDLIHGSEQFGAYFVGIIS